jgi:hypothetical protein
MTWLQRYRIRRFVRNSLWIYPVATMVMAILAVQRFFPEPEDRALAAQSDSQGVGGVQQTT